MRRYHRDCFSFFVQIGQGRLEIPFRRFSGQRSFESEMCGGLYVFGGIGDFGDFSVLTF
jgi:hypothetical protein